MKTCTNCRIEKPLVDFYRRSGIESPADEGHYLSECKQCMKKRSKVQRRLPKTKPREFTERLAMGYMKQYGIPALPGKAVSAADVDVVVWGHVWVEVKYAREVRKKGKMRYTWTMTGKQKERGFLAHIVLLICDHRDSELTYHWFRADDPVFYMNGRMKAGLDYWEGRTQMLYGNGRVIMNDSQMEQAQDRFSLIYEAMREISDHFKQVS